MVRENFQIYGVQITGKCIHQPNISYPSPRQNFARLLLLPTGKLLIPQAPCFLKICFPSRKGEEETMYSHYDFEQKPPLVKFCKNFPKLFDFKDPTIDITEVMKSM